MIRTLCHRICQGDAEASEALLQMLEPIIHRMATAFAKRYARLPLEIDDYIQEGRIALLRTAQQAHEQQLQHFTAYANTTVRNAMLDAVRVVYPSKKVNSLDRLACSDAVYEYTLSIPAPFCLSPEQFLLRKESIKELHRAMENIPLRENVWVRYRFGFDDAPQALCTAAEYFHLTKGRAKRVEHLALGHLRENLTGKKYRMLHKEISCVHPIAKSHRRSDSHAAPSSSHSARDGSSVKKTPAPAVRQTSTASA